MCALGRLRVGVVRGRLGLGGREAPKVCQVREAPARRIPSLRVVGESSPSGPNVLGVVPETEGRTSRAVRVTLLSSTHSRGERRGRSTPGLFQGERGH